MKKVPRLQGNSRREREASWVLRRGITALLILLRRDRGGGVGGRERWSKVGNRLRRC